MNQQTLVEYLMKDGVLHSPQIIHAFLEIDRADFVRPENRGEAYADYPLDIGYGATISQPYTVAFMMELLQPLKGQKILDVGAGSGWTTALLGWIVGKSGKVIGTEIIPELVEFANTNLKKCSLPHMRVFPARGGQAGKATLGWPDTAPYHKILVSAAAKAEPIELLHQLAIGGRLVMPIGSSVWQIDKVSPDKIERKEFQGFAFVPLKQ